MLKDFIEQQKRLLVDHQNMENNLKSMYQDQLDEILEKVVEVFPNGHPDFVVGIQQGRFISSIKHDGSFVICDNTGNEIEDADISISFMSEIIADLLHILAGNQIDYFKN